MLVELADLWLFGNGLVAETPDDHLQDAALGDDAGRAAVFVDHHRERNLLYLHLFKQVAHVLVLRHDQRGSLERGNRLLARAAALLRHEVQHVFDGHEACNVVEVVLVDGIAAVPRLGKRIQEVADARLLFDANDIGARHHRLAHLPVAELEDVVQHLLFALFEQAAFLTVGDEAFQFLD